MGKLLDQLSSKMTQVGVRAGTHAANQWLMKEIPKLGNVSRASLLKDPAARADALLGSVNLFYYDAKLKDQLPYWDRFPVAMVIDLYDDGFLGLNFHYLPIRARIVLLDRLMDLKTNNKMNQNTRLKATYHTLKGVARYKAFEPCLKRYLTSHVQSQIVPIPADQWHMVCMLPVESFQKASKQHVWSQSGF